MTSLKKDESIIKIFLCLIKVKRAHGLKAVSLRNGLCFLAGDFFIWGVKKSNGSGTGAPAVSALIDKILSLLLSIIHIYTYLTFIIGDDM